MAAENHWQGHGPTACAPDRAVGNFAEIGDVGEELFARVRLKSARFVGDKPSVIARRSQHRQTFLCQVKALEVNASKHRRLAQVLTPEGTLVSVGN